MNKQYALFSITFRPGQSRAADASTEEWMNFKAKEGFEFRECQMAGLYDKTLEGPVIALTVIMEKGR